MRNRRLLEGRRGWELGVPRRDDAGPELTVGVYHELTAYAFRVRGLLPDLPDLARLGVDHVLTIREFQLAELILADDASPSVTKLRR